MQKALRTLAVAVVAGGFGAAPAMGATATVADGLGVGGGTVQARIAGDTASIVRNGVPWVFYGANPEYGYRLRVAQLGSPRVYATLDGAGGANGRTSDSVATDVSAVQQGTTVHVFYRDNAAHTLRHAWLSGSSWHFETLDGSSTLGGRTTHNVGLQSVALVYQNQLNVFYRDATAGDIRRAVFNGTTWRFSVIDGNSATGGRTSAVVGDAIKTGIWGSRLHLLYTSGVGLREAQLGAGGTWMYATIVSDGGGPLALLRVSDSAVYATYVDANGIEAALWNGVTWSTGRYITWAPDVITGMTIFRDGATPVLAEGLIQCYGSGGCDEMVGIARWNGSTFDDPYFGGPFFVFGEPPGNPSSAVTINNVGQLLVGGIGHETEPDINDEVLLRMVGPF